MQQYAHFFYNINGNPTNVLSGVPKTLQGAGSGYTGLDIAWRETAGQPQYNRDITFPQVMLYTATLMATWPAFVGDRYIEMTVANPVTMIDVQIMPARVRGSATPDDDIQTVSASWLGNGSGGFETLQLNAYQASGVTRQVTPWAFVGIAHVAIPDAFA